MIDPNSPDYLFSRMAVDKAKLCQVDASGENPAPRVAIVLAKNQGLLGWAAKGVGGEYCTDGTTHAFESPGNEHAEQSLLAKLGDIDFSDVVAYVTLEPCTHRRKGTPCAQLLTDRRIRQVFVGNSDPHPDIGALAWRHFHKNGVIVRDFPAELRNEARRDNHAFFDKFVYSEKLIGNAQFDYGNQGQERILGPAGREFKTRWTPRGNGSIYGLDCENNVCVADHCTSFDQVDDPGRWFEDSHYTKPVHVGQIIIFRNSYGFALVLIQDVKYPVDGMNGKVKFTYELRYRENAESGHKDSGSSSA